MNDESSRSHLIVTVMVEVENKEKNIVFFNISLRSIIKYI